MIRKLSMPFYLFLALFLGICSGMTGVSWLFQASEMIADIFIKLFKLISLPIIFCSLVSTLTSFSDSKESKRLITRVFRYTLLTTVIAALLALGIYRLIQPTVMDGDALVASIPQNIALPEFETDYLGYVLSIIPSNIASIFLDNNILGALALALLFSLSINSLPKDQKNILHRFFASLYAAILKFTHYITILMPIAVYAFVSLFVFKFAQTHEVLDDILWYLLCVVLANVIQGTVVLPILLLRKKISPIQAFKGMFSALTFAFFSKSSSATLPIAIKCAETKLKVDRRVAGFSFPLCTTINMNGCAAFILITVLFVSSIYGYHFNVFQQILWVLVATIAAIGNASIPMGCYFLSSAFLAAMGVPLEIMGIILPFYTLIDMLETMINVWSDACVTLIIDKEEKNRKLNT